MSFWLTENGSHSGSTNVWLTPRWLLDLLGPFDLDPCGHPGWKTAENHFYENDNGLYQDWDGIAWVNPPYGIQTMDWVERWAKHGEGFLLVANRSDTSWWQEAAKSADGALFPRGRIHFLNSEGIEVKGTAFSSVIFARGIQSYGRLQRASFKGVLLK